MKRIVFVLVTLAVLTAVNAFAVTTVTLKNYSATTTKLIPAYCTYTKGSYTVDGATAEPVVIKFANMTTVRSSATVSVASIGDYRFQCFKKTDNSATSMLMYFDSDSANYTSIQNFLLRRR